MEINKSMCNVIHIRDKKGTDNEVYIGRGSKWGNPFRINTNSNREKVINEYSLYITAGEGMHLLNDLHELRGKTLVCFCKPHKCHGDVLAELVLDEQIADREQFNDDNEVPF
jgi:sorbitol-specific phosphotransferase system component IIBC